MAKARGNIPRRRLGRYLRELRQQSNLTLADAAKRIGRGVGTLSDWRPATAERSTSRISRISATCTPRNPCSRASTDLRNRRMRPHGGTSTAICSPRVSMCTWISRPRRKRSRCIARTGLSRQPGIPHARSVSVANRVASSPTAFVRLLGRFYRSQ
ncbi:helix-turn-helix domain-containing protein [Nocardia callitridis]|uniref:helix-turn-helix domain-containing protein n=1 Tax=Nocardia callitridis TaxID=648753 RepID=UPI003CD0548D